MLSLLQQKVLQFAGGDYWGGGSDWPALIVPADAADRQTMIDELQRTFTRSR